MTAAVKKKSVAKKTTAEKPNSGNGVGRGRGTHKPGCPCRTCAKRRGEKPPAQRKGVYLMPDALLKELHDAALEDNKPQAACVREAVEDWLEKRKKAIAARLA